MINLKNMLWNKMLYLYKYKYLFSCCSVTQLCPILCSPIDCRMPGFSVHHCLPEFAQTHAHWLSDAIQPSPSHPAFSLSQNQSFSSELALCIRWPKYWSFRVSISPSNGYLGLISFRNWLVWSPCSPRGFQESSLAPQFKSINSLALSLLYGPALTSKCLFIYIKYNP